MEKQINAGYQMVSSRLRTTIVFFALCGLVAGSAFAGNLTSNPTTFAHEIATAATALTIAPQVYTMGIARNPGQNFIIRYTLSNTAVTFGPNVGLTLTYGGAAVGVTTVLRSGGLGANTVEFDVNLAGGGTAVGDTFTFNGTVYFAAGSAVGASTNVTVDVRDVISALDTTLSVTVPPASYSRVLATLGGAATLTATTQTRATIDATAATPLTLFVAQTAGTADDDTLTVAKAFVTTAATTTAQVAANTGAYSLAANDLVTFTITGDFTGITAVGLDLDGSLAITPAAGANTTTAETFTINAGLSAATLTVDGNRLGALGGTARAVWFTKAAGVTLNPRVFTIAATVNPTLASGRSSQNRSIGTGAADWFQWVQNGTTMVAPYLSFTPGNGVKFRFVNSSNNAITILVSVVLDQGTFTQNVSTFTVPATSSQQYTFSDTPAAGTNELGPIATLLTGTQPVRGKATFTALTASANVAGVELIYSPVGVVTLVNLPQQPSW